MIANAAKPLWLRGDLLMPVSSGRQVRYDLNMRIGFSVV